jgi:hypothetical protein
MLDHASNSQTRSSQLTIHPTDTTKHLYIHTRNNQHLYIPPSTYATNPNKTIKKTKVKVKFAKQINIHIV